MTAHLARAQLLLQTRRYPDAEAALRRALLIEPENAHAHALLAIALDRQKRSAEAAREAQAAVGLAPEDPFTYYILAQVLAGQQDAPALAAIQEALRLEPKEPDYYALLGHIYTRQKEWRKALDAAVAGLRFDPEHVGCLNLQGAALVGLERHDEAARSFQAALALDPENAAAHASQGWAWLRSGAPEPALRSFREALRLNPMSGWARAGIVEALKARNPVYRLMLRYFLWMSSLTSEERVEVWGGVWGLKMILDAAAAASVLVWLLLLPLNLLYNFFVALTWIARPFFALLLRFDRLGRLALPPEEMAASSWLAVCLLAAGLSALGGLLLRDVKFLVGVLVALLMIVPAAAVFHCPPGRRRAVLIVCSLMLALMGLGVFVLALTGTALGVALAIALALAFVLARGVYVWVAILLINIE